MKLFDIFIDSYKHFVFLKEIRDYLITQVLVIERHVKALNPESGKKKGRCVRFFARFIAFFWCDKQMYNISENASLILRLSFYTPVNHLLPRCLTLRSLKANCPLRKIRQSQNNYFAMTTAFQLDYKIIYVHSI